VVSQRRVGQIQPIVVRVVVRGARAHRDDESALLAHVRPLPAKMPLSVGGVVLLPSSSHRFSFTR
jgi:hypothetical protein